MVKLKTNKILSTYRSIYNSLILKAVLEYNSTTLTAASLLQHNVDGIQWVRCLIMS